MTSDREFDALLRSWFEESAPSGQPQGLLESVVSATGHIRPRPAWLVGMRGGPMPATDRPGLNRYAPLALATAAVVVALLIGIGLILRSPNIGPSPVPGPTHSGLPQPTAHAAAWTSTGSMGAPRRGQSATLLRDGRVLVAGGEGGDGSNRASAELYDSATGTWTTTESMLSYSQNVSLTVLLDGRVLAAGGYAPTGTFSELYDPGTGTWTATGPMVTPREHFTATLLPDGKVLVAGGEYDAVLASAELYDPATGTWTATAPMSRPRENHVASLLPDGRVLVAGGSTWEEMLASAELYDPASGTWTATGAMLTTYNTETATLLADGKVLVSGFVGCAFGASGPCSFASVVEVYDPGTGSWTATGPMRVVREGFTATLLPDGKVLVAGGSQVVTGSLSDLDTASAELYDPVTGTWTATAGMVVAREFHTATRLPDGRVLVAGGSSGSWAGQDVASAEIYNAGAGR